MAQVQADFPDLSQMFGAQSVYPAILGMERFRQAQQAQQGNMANQAQDMEIAKARAPVELQHLMSQTEENRARVPYMQAQTDTLRDTLGVQQAVPKQMRVDAAIADYAAKTSDKEIKDHENAIRKGLIDPSPEVRKQAEFMWQQLDRVKQKKLELDNAAKIHQYDSDSRKQSAREVAMIGASSRENVAATRAAAANKADPTIQQQLAKFKKASEKIAHIDSVLAFMEADDPVAAKLRVVRQQLLPQADAELAAAAKQEVDIPGVTKGSVPTVPPKQVAREPAGAVPTSQMSEEDKTALAWANANPKDPRAAKIKEKLGVK